jgi:hypothetical protein
MAGVEQGVKSPKEEKVTGKHKNRKQVYQRSKYLNELSTKNSRSQKAINFLNVAP